MQTLVQAIQGQFLKDMVVECSNNHAIGRARLAQVVQVHHRTRTLVSQASKISQRHVARCVCVSGSQGSSHGDDCFDDSPQLPQSPLHAEEEAITAASAAGSKPQQQQQSTRSQDDLQLEYLRAQAAKLEALEQYQQLMEQYAAPSSSISSSSNSSSKQPSGNATADRRQQGGTAAAADVPVLDAALLIAKHAHPDMDVQTVRQQLDDLAAEVAASLPEGVRYPLRIIKEINRVLFDVHGFQGNDQDYYNPDNSYLNKVLETKRGIPISLSLIYIEVAARLDLPMAGVNLPAHFMIRPQVEGMELLVDAFNGGELTALEDAEEVLGKLIGYQVKLDPRFVRGDTPYFSSRQLLLRLLNNLRQIYMTLNMPEEALWVVRFMRATAPQGTLTELQRDEGMCLYGLGRFHEASEVLVQYLDTSTDHGDVDVVKAILQRIKDRAAAAAAPRDDKEGRNTEQA